MKQRILISIVSMFIMTLLYSTGTCAIDIWTYTVSMFIIVALTYLMIRQQKRYEELIEKTSILKLQKYDEKV